MIRKNHQKLPKQIFHRQKARFASHGEIYFSIFLLLERKFVRVSTGVMVEKLKSKNRRRQYFDKKETDCYDK